MVITCPRCGGLAEPAGHEDARAFFQCPTCDRVWATHISAILEHPSQTKAPRVLVADDSPELLGLLTAWLEDEGCIVIAVGSGRQAIDAAISHRPDVGFIDVVLPPPDGYNVCEVLTRRFRMAVVMMTGMTNPNRDRAAESGAVMMLQKPFTREAMVEAFNEARARQPRDPQLGPAVALG